MIKQGGLEGGRNLPITDQTLNFFQFHCDCCRCEARPTHSCIAALQERFGVPEEQPVVRIHHVGLPLGHGKSVGLLLFLFFVLVLVFVRAVELLVPAASFLQQRLLQRNRRIKPPLFDSKSDGRKRTLMFGLRNCVLAYRVSMLMMTTCPHSSTSISRLHSFL